MPNYMLHFACNPSNQESTSEKWIADSCIMAEDLAQAETQARELIASHHYRASTLIAYAELNEEGVATLSELESTLYLKAQTNSAHQAVLFSQWNEPAQKS